MVLTSADIYLDHSGGPPTTTEQTILKSFDSYNNKENQNCGAMLLEQLLVTGLQTEEASNNTKKRRMEEPTAPVNHETTNELNVNCSCSSNHLSSPYPNPYSPSFSSPFFNTGTFKQQQQHLEQPSLSNYKTSTCLPSYHHYPFNNTISNNKSFLVDNPKLTNIPFFKEEERNYKKKKINNNNYQFIEKYSKGECFTKAAEEKSNELLGDLLFSQNQFEKALDYYKKSLNEKRDEEKLLKTAFCYLELKSFRNSLNLCKEVLRENDENEKAKDLLTCLQNLIQEEEKRGYSSPAFTFLLNHSPLTDHVDTYEHRNSFIEISVDNPAKIPKEILVAEKKFFLALYLNEVEFNLFSRIEMKYNTNTLRFEQKDLNKPLFSNVVVNNLFYKSGCKEPSSFNKADEYFTFYLMDEKNIYLKSIKLCLSASHKVNNSSCTIL
ncbi:hypothetical protein ABK040_009311 [Willaertia magna]